MSKILDKLRKSILNSFFYNLIQSLSGWAIKATLFTPNIYTTYKPQGESVTKTKLFRVVNWFSKLLDKLLDKFQKKFYQSILVTNGLRIHEWLKGSYIYSIIIQFNLVYLLILYVFLDRFIRSYVGGISSVWDELLIIIFIGCIIIRRIFINKKYVFTSIDIPLLSFILIYMSVTFVYSPEIGIGIEGLRAVTQYMIWYFLIVQLLDSETVLERVLFLVVISVGILGAHGTYQYLTGAEMLGNWVDSSETLETRAYSIAGGPNALGSLMVLNIPVGFGMFLTEKDILKKLLYLVATLFMGLGLIFTFSRGAWFAAFIGIIVMFLFIAKKMIISIATLLMAVVMSVNSIWNRIYHMFTKEYISKASTGGRLYRWNYAFEQWSESKMFGLGVGRFGGAVATNHGLSPFYMDNYYLKTLTEAGVVGLAAYAMLLLSTLWNMFVYIRGTLDKRYRIIMIGIFSGAVGLLVHNGVENIFESPFSLVYFWTYIGILVAMNKIDKRRAR